MIVLFAPHAKSMFQLTEALHERDVVVARSWRELAALATHARASVIELDDLSNPDNRRYLNDIKNGVHAATVLITPFSRDSARWLIDAPADIVVWCDEIHKRLADAVAVVTSKSTISRLLESIQRDPRFSTTFRRVAAVLLTGNPPLRTIEEWATAAFVSVSTLERQFRGCFQDRHATPHLFLWAIQLVWASDKLRSGDKPARLCALLGIHPRTFQRHLRLVTGQTVTEFRHSSDAAVQSLVRSFSLRLE